MCMDIHYATLNPFPSDVLIVVLTTARLISFVKDCTVLLCRSVASCFEATAGGME
jgi:hypothetical protein